MKTKTIAILLLIGFFYSCQQPHRLDEWKTKKITSIEITLAEEDGNTSSFDIADKAKIKRIMDFLFQTRFEPYTSESSRAQSMVDQWGVKLIFAGQQDQIYLYKNHALIGKSIYFIKEGVLEDFIKLIKK